MEPVVLSIAGFDPSSGAGVTADIKTSIAHKCYAVTCISALTVQNTLGVYRVEPVLGEVVSQTLFDLAADFEIAAVRIGMLGNREVTEQVAAFLEATRVPHVVLDPIVRSSSGAELLDASGFDVLKKRLLPLSELVTPNLSEAAALTGLKVEDLDGIRKAGHSLLELGVRNAVVTGGHLGGTDAVDLLLWRAEGSEEILEEELSSPRIDSNATHGTGCAFATSVACHLARGFRIPDAVAGAKRFVTAAIENAQRLGHGKGPMELLWPLRREE